MSNSIQITELRLTATPLFFDHHSSTPVSSRVELKMNAALREYFGNPHSTTHMHGWNAQSLIDNAATNISNHFNGLEVIFTSGATEANNLAFNLNFQEKRKNVLIGPLEHSAVFEPAARLANRLGGKLITVPCDSDGRIVPEFVTDEMLANCAIVSISFASGEIGTVQTELDGLRARAQCNGALFHSDLSQSLQSPLARDFASRCDAISISAHKIYGPQGIGALIATESFLTTVEPILVGGGQQNGIRAGTVPTFLCVGLGEAVEETFEWIESEGPAALLHNSKLLFKKLKNVVSQDHGDLVELVGPKSFSDRTPGNVTVLLPNSLDSSDILLACARAFSASQGSACHSGQETASHSLRAIGLGDREARRIIRFGLNRNCRQEEIELVVDSIIGCI